MLETVDETIKKLCGFIQEGLESDLTANDCGNLPDLIKALGRGRQDSSDVDTYG